VETKVLSSWGHLLDQVQQLQQARDETAHMYSLPSSDLLFRGHGDASWPLKTTLERYVSRPFSFIDYFNAVSQAKPQVETFTANHWELMASSDFRAWASNYESLGDGRIPNLDYLVYLRHHGFPSPLLDWSRSFYIAAYFAFEHAHAENTAIFIFWEKTGAGKFGSSKHPQIHIFGPTVRSHPRTSINKVNIQFAVSSLPVMSSPLMNGNMRSMNQ